MNLKMLVWLLVAMNVVLGGFCLFNTLKGSSKIPVAFVNSSKVLSSYMGMKETQEVYQKKVAAWQSDLDSLQSQIQDQEKALVLLEGKEKATAAEQVNKSKASFFSQKEALERKATEEGNQLTQGMLNQINTFIEAYAKDHHYVLVHGSTTSGSVLYADESIDITEAIIKGLNESYKK
jgi:outer membrane protein